VRGYRHWFLLDPDILLNYVARKGKVTRAQAAKDHPSNTRGQIAYHLDQLRRQKKVRRYRGKGGAFVYKFRSY
jgi:hypothetical protein